MDKASTNPLIVSLFFVLRCVIPLILMLGVSYLLQRLGVIAEPPPPPPDNAMDNNQPLNSEEGLAHGNS